MLFDYLFFNLCLLQYNLRDTHTIIKVFIVQKLYALRRT